MQNLIWHSPLSPEACAERIEAELQQDRRHRKPLWGKVTAEGFSLRRAFNLRNPFAPYIKGTFEPQADGGTVVRATCAVPQAAKIGAVIWAAIWLIAPCAMTVIVDLIVIGFLAAFGDQLAPIAEELRPLLVSLPITSVGFPIMGALVAVGFPALFIVLRRGDCDNLTARLTTLLEADTFPEVANTSS
jgi:hypothetical protein